MHRFAVLLSDLVLTPQTMLPETGQQVTTWLIPVGIGAVVLGVGALFWMRRGRGKRKA